MSRIRMRSNSMAKPKAKKVTKKPSTRRTTKAKVAPRAGAGPQEEGCELRLYVAGHTPKSKAAIENLRRLCDEKLAGKFTVEVIDLLKDPTLARGDQILAIPTLVRRLPSPMRRIIGDLSNTERVLVGLNLTTPDT